MARAGQAHNGWQWFDINNKHYSCTHIRFTQKFEYMNGGNSSFQIDEQCISLAYCYSNWNYIRHNRFNNRKIDINFKNVTSLQFKLHELWNKFIWQYLNIELAFDTHILCDVSIFASMNVLWIFIYCNRWYRRKHRISDNQTFTDNLIMLFHSIFHNFEWKVHSSKHTSSYKFTFNAQFMFDKIASITVN